MLRPIFSDVAVCLSHTVPVQRRYVVTYLHKRLVNYRYPLSESFPWLTIVTALLLAVAALLDRLSRSSFAASVNAAEVCALVTPYRLAEVLLCSVTALAATSAAATEPNSASCCKQRAPCTHHQRGRVRNCMTHLHIHFGVSVA